MKFFFYVLSLVFVFCEVQSQSSGSHHVGFKSIHFTDSARTYKPDVSTTHPLHYRPGDIDIWYPAIPSSNKKILFGELVQLFEDRSRAYQEEVQYDSLYEEMIAYLAGSLNVTEKALTSFETSSVNDAPPLPRKFPLVIYMASFNGISFENVTLFEALAKRGYVVACIQSVGRYPGNMTTDWKDVLEQINDATAEFRLLSKLSFAESENVAIAGYSRGGLAAWFVSDNLNANALISLDGSECHAYGLGDDAYFPDIRKELLKVRHMTLPYLYLQKDSADGIPDSIFALHQRSPHVEWIKVRNATHEDFSSLTYLSSRLNNDSSARPFVVATNLIVEFLDEHLKNTNGFHRLKSALVTRQLIDTIYTAPVSKSSFLKISGVVKEKGNGEAMPYVSIGLKGKNYGTVSDLQGAFSLDIPAQDDDTLKFSCLGFEDQQLPVKNLRTRKMLTIQMSEKRTTMNEIVVEASRLKTKVLGHTSRSRFFGGKLGSDQLGTSIGVRMNVRRKVLLDAFRFTVSYNKLDTAVFRLNILSIKNGMPDKSLIHENIYCGIGKRTGTHTVDLLPYSIIADQDFLVALE